MAHKLGPGLFAATPRLREFAIVFHSFSEEHELRLPHMEDEAAQLALIRVWAAHCPELRDVSFKDRLEIVWKRSSVTHPQTRGVRLEWTVVHKDHNIDSEVWGYAYDSRGEDF